MWVSGDPNALSPGLAGTARAQREASNCSSGERGFTPRDEHLQETATFFGQDAVPFRTMHQNRLMNGEIEPF
jgi:hypothetical protein